ncbi:MAG: hypothetical protein AAF765_16415 [Bacteroidota bacterium]
MRTHWRKFKSGNTNDTWLVSSRNGSTTFDKGSQEIMKNKYWKVQYRAFQRQKKRLLALADAVKIYLNLGWHPKVVRILYQ